MRGYDQYLTFCPSFWTYEFIRFTRISPGEMNENVLCID